MSFPEAREVLPADEPLLSIPEAAEKMGVVVTHVFDLLGEHKLIAVTVDGTRMLPAVFFGADGRVNRFVPGVIALLTDGGYDDREIFDWLFTADDSLPGRPVDGLHGHLAREVMRRAQAAGL
ncbi:MULTISPECIES: Rv2175c family DNA-binding protein [unclassified Corynebacterium]|uniref:Rv2175c family DNA-binding protein n=1 Tax=unclassified Corynebacterium TaxID=2624378 RepID=UPI003524893B